jgi:hypothetical protein
MKRIASPMMGGIFSSFVLELLVYPALYEVWRWNTAVKWLQNPKESGENALEGLKLISLSPPAKDAGD